MNVSRDPDRLIHAFLFEGAERLNDRVYDAVRADIDTKRQRVVIGPWRLPTMNKLIPIGLGAAALVAVLLVGSQLVGAPVSTLGPGSAMTPPPTASAPAPSVAAPSPAASAPISPPPLTQTFTSQVHGLSMSYPEGWEVFRAATEPWTDRPGVPQFLHPGIDMLSDPAIDELFLAIGSQPIGESSPEEWVAANSAGFGCSSTEAITVDGAAGRIGADCRFAFVTTAGRGYWIQVYRSGDDWGQDASAPYDRAWFEVLLATVQLHPEDAVDALPSASP